MKNILITAFALSAFTVMSFSVQGATGDVTISDIGVTTSGTMPGSATDFFIFQSDNYSSSKSTNNGTSSSDLTSFYMAGGVSAYSSPGTGDGRPLNHPFSTIINPAGHSVTTGEAQATSPEAFALEPGNPSTEAGPDQGLNSSFTYNDFYVWVLVSNTNGDFTDSSVSLTVRDNKAADAALPGYQSDPSSNFTSNPVSFTDNANATGALSGPTTAEYVEFEVKGMATAQAAGFVPDLVLEASSPTGVSYIGGVSFESVPENSTFAMVLAGFGLLGFIIRRQRS